MMSICKVYAKYIIQHHMHIASKVDIGSTVNRKYAIQKYLKYREV